MEYDIMIDRIKQMCTDLGVSPSKAYIDSGVGKDFAYSIKQGKTPSVARVKLLADYFSVSTDYLLGKTNIKKEPPPEEVERVHALANALLSNGSLPDLSDESVRRLIDFINSSGSLLEKFRNKD